MSLIKETKVMRTLVDLGDVQLQALDELSRKEKRSRAALIRQAIDEYLARFSKKRFISRNSAIVYVGIRG
jgi:metal-responsive CopG/Arc/MetJ family transcriptional regulator